MVDVQDRTTGDEPAGMNRRQALGLAGAVAAGTVGATVLTASPAAAQTSAPRGTLPMFSISLRQAQRVVRAAVEYAEENDFSMFIVVVDPCGDEKASARMDGNGSASTVLAPIKARTSAAFRAPTIDFSQADAARIASFTTAGFSVIGGGRPISVDGMVIGAIGVGGGTPDEDDQVAQAAIAAVFG
jgi:glc operon protein GlcG